MIKPLIQGAGYLPRGLSLIWRKGVKRYSLAPILINIVVFGLLIYAAASGFDLLVHRWLPSGDAWWWHLLRSLFWLIFTLGVATSVFFGFTLLANLIAAPFNGKLSEQVERRLRGEVVSESGSLMRETVRAISSEGRKWLYFLPRALPLLILTFIPGINLIATPFWLAFTAWFMGMEYADYPSGNHGGGFKQLLTDSRQNRWLLLGFGGAVALAMLIPGINLLTMPAAVAGATALWVEKIRP